jgi:hypothetical protein
LRETRSGRIVHRSVDVAARKTGSRSLLHSDLVALSNLALKLLPANFTALSKGNVKRLAANHLVVHLGDSLGGFIGSGETNETETLGSALVISHDLAARDRTKRLELATKLLIVNIIFQVLDVEVNALVLAQLLHLRLLVRLAQLLFTLGLLLCASHEELLAFEVSIMKLIDGLLSFFVLLVVDKTKAFALAFLVDGNKGRSNPTKTGEELFKLLLGNLGIDVLDIEVGEVSFHLVQLGLTLLARDVVANVDLFVVEKHAIDSFDGVVRSFSSLVVNETVAFGATVLISGDLAGQNVAEGSKRIVKPCCQ